MADDSRHQVNLLDFFAFLLRWRRFLITCVLVVAFCVGVIVLLVPVQYKSTAVVRPQESGGQGIGSLIASKLGVMGQLANLAPSLVGSTPQEMYLSILKSRWMAENVIERFDLRTVYKMKKARIEDVIEELDSHTFFDMDDISSTIVIQAEDHDATRARDMTQYYVDQLDSRSQEFKSRAGTSEKEFVQQRLTDERNRLASLEDSLYAFQLATGVLNVEEQVKATIEASAALEAQRLAAKAELEMNRRVLGMENPETEYTRFKLASIDSSLRDLMHRSDSGRNSFLLQMDEVPSQGLTYVRLLRDIEIQQLLVAYLLQQYEDAKIAELRNTPTLIRLDPPQVPTKRSWPHRTLFVLVGAFGAFIFASAIALFLEMLSRASRDPQDPQYHRLENIRRSWATKNRA